MKYSFFLADLGGRKSADALVGAVESCDEMLLIVMRDVKLEAETHAIAFERPLPHTFGTCDGIGGLFRPSSGRLAVESQRKTDAALRPNAFDAGMIRQDLPLVGSAHGRNGELEMGILQRKRGHFDAVNALIQAIDGSLERAVLRFRNMQDKMQNGIADL